MLKITKYLIGLIVLVSLIGCGSGVAPIGGLVPNTPVDLPPIAPDFQGGQLQISGNYKIKGTINDVVEPQVTKSGYIIYGGVQ